MMVQSGEGYTWLGTQSGLGQWWREPPWRFKVRTVVTEEPKVDLGVATDQLMMLLSRSLHLIQL